MTQNSRSLIVGLALCSWYPFSDFHKVTSAAEGSTTILTVTKRNHTKHDLHYHLCHFPYCPMQAVFCIKLQMHVVKIYRSLTEMSMLHWILQTLFLFPSTKDNTDFNDKKASFSITKLNSLPLRKELDCLPLLVNKVQHFPSFTFYFHTICNVLMVKFLCLQITNVEVAKHVECSTLRN